MNKDNIWTDIKGYEGYYKINRKGEVYSLLYKIILKPGINKKTGYKAVILHKNGKKTTKKIHRLIAETFIPNPLNKPCVDHIDGNRLNNNISNLHWVTYRENTNNPITKGRTKRKTKNNLSWFKKMCKPVICIEAQMFFNSVNEAGRILNIDARKICSVCKGKIEKAGGFHWKYAEEKAC